MKSFSEFQEDYTRVINPVKPVTDLIGAGLGAYELGKKAISGLSNIFQARKKDDDVIKPKGGEVTKQRELLKKAEKKITKPKKGEKKKAKKVVDTFKKVRKKEGETMMKLKQDNEILKKGPGDLVPDAKKTYLRKLLDNLRKEEVMAAPTNSVGDGSKVALPPTHEPGIKKKKNKRGSGAKKRKKKTYAYGGYGSRKNWMV